MALVHPHNRLSRWLAILSLAVYGCVGLLGHALHGVMPCGDAACDAFAQAADHCSCCHHEPPARDAARDQGVRVDAAGHDPHECSLCALIGKIKTGYASSATASEHSQLCCTRENPLAELLPADLVLASSPRGPPRA